MDQIKCDKEIFIERLFRSSDFSQRQLHPETRRDRARHIDIPMKMDKNPFSDILLLLKYYTTLKQEKPIVFLGYTIKPNIYGSIAAHMLNIPVINNIAGLGALFTTRSWVTQLVKSLYKFSLSRSRKVFPK